MMEIGLITGNSGKLKEISRWMGGMGARIVMEEGPFIEVQAETLEEVVSYGMEVIASEKKGDRWLIKDDSGLFIESLGGFPGVYSSYVQKTIGNRGILSLMENIEDRSASFRTVIGLHIPGKGLSMFKGECKGTITTEERGRQGFGYDPIFIPKGHDITFAEMDTAMKNSISHRIRAMKKLTDFIADSNLDRFR